MKLPDSEMDRFMICLSMGYPSVKEEVEILKRKETGLTVNAVTDAAGLLAMQKEAANVYVHDAVYDYIVRLVNATRNHTYLELGGSPRASLSLTAMSRSLAYISGRDYVLPEDVQAVFLPVLIHRVLENRQARIDAVSKTTVLEEILQQVPKPAQRKDR